MNRIPTAEEFFEQHIQRGVNNTHTNYLNTAIEFAKLHVEAALKEASIKAKITERKQYIDSSGGYITIPTIYKRYILNAYPLENIK